ncbi:MAG: hypothetical protein J5597_05185 [Spirochaetaceae bacterium]|nr:hypothetical protein [Spirochaetaceae bacterium]MBO7486733.1 hypothetical protein [Spirochaetaceae bacterium]
MCLNQRYDEDPPWGDEKGFMWSPWLLHRYFELNDIDDRTESQNEEIDMIYNAAKQGRSALEAVEKKLRNKK